MGDIIGSPYEFDRGDKSKDFPLFIKKSHFTDDTLMTAAVGEALYIKPGEKETRSDDEIRQEVAKAMIKWGQRYINAGYGAKFSRWILKGAFTGKVPEPYGSFGNGSAMRVSPVGWLYDSLEETRRIARLTAEVTHNHPEGIKGAEAVASAIFMARKGESKEAIKAYIESEFEYDLSRTLDEIRPRYHHVETCQETVPEAITAFLEGEDFEDVVRCAVSLGGDADTLACIAASIAEAFYPIPEQFKIECYRRTETTSGDLHKVLKMFGEERGGLR